MSAVREAIVRVDVRNEHHTHLMVVSHELRLELLEKIAGEVEQPARLRTHFTAQPLLAPLAVPLLAPSATSSNTSLDLYMFLFY